MATVTWAPKAAGDGVELGGIGSEQRLDLWNEAKACGLEEVRAGAVFKQSVSSGPFAERDRIGYGCAPGDDGTRVR